MKELIWSWGVNRLDNRSQANANYNVDNDNGRLVSISLSAVRINLLKMYESLCSYKNLLLAFKKARMHKTKIDYVIKFQRNLKENLEKLKTELVSCIYQPKPLKTFILKTPKTRKISKSRFRDRIIHHALINIIAYGFEKDFIYDSFANQIGKGTLKAIERFNYFKT